GSDNTVRVWQTATGKELRQLGDKEWTVHGLSPDGKLLAATRKDSPKILRLVDVQAGDEVRQLPLPAELARLAFSPDGKLLAAACGELEQPGSINIWEIEGGRRRGTLAGHTAMVFALAFSPDGKVLAS